MTAHTSVPTAQDSPSWEYIALARQFPPRSQRGSQSTTPPQPPATGGHSSAPNAGPASAPGVRPSPYAPPGSDARLADARQSQTGLHSPSLSATNITPVPVVPGPQIPYVPAVATDLLPFVPAYDPLESVLAEEARAAPSLPIILLSAAIGVVACVATYFLASEVAGLRIELGVGLAVLALCFGLGATGGVLSAATGSRAAVPNILFSCGVILLTLLFFGICSLTGALGATLLLFLRG